MPGPARDVPVLAVCGLAAEARLASGPDVRAVAGGGRSAALALAIEAEIRGGVRALISFGLAGALSDDLRPGTLIVATAILDGTTTYPTDDAWSGAMTRVLPSAVRGTLAGSESIVADAAGKAALSAATGALAVDMESHVAARLAARHGLPFVALRAVADPAERSLPPAARVAMKPNGVIDLAAILGSLASAPGQLPQLLRIGRDAQRAMRSLGDAHRLLGVRLGYADLD